MSNFRKIYLRISIIFFVAIWGCNPSSKESDLSEQEVAVAFFEAVYNQKDLQKVLSLSSTNLKTEVKKYKTANHLARKFLNMSFDSVELETSSTNTQILDEYSTQVTLTVLFTGQRDGSIYKDYKKVLVVKENNIWLVDKLLNHQ